MSAHDFDLNPLDAETEDEEPQSRFRIIVRAVLATVIVVVAILATCVVMVPADEAVVISQLGNPVRVITKSGLAWKLPAPLESTIPIDLRLRTTSTGLQNVGTRDGIQLLVQTYAAWQVPNDPNQIRQFLRAVRNDPNEAAVQLRQFVGAQMGLSASNFNLADLVNSDPAAVHIDQLEAQLSQQVSAKLLQSYGIQLRQVGIERMTLPAVSLTATVNRMASEREVVASQKTAEGNRQAAQITADADRDAREVVSTAQRKATQTEADAEVAASAVYARAYQANPGLYTTLRSLEAARNAMGPNTTLILRTDSAPFKVLSDGPGGAAAK